MGYNRENEGLSCGAAFFDITVRTHSFSLEKNRLSDYISYLVVLGRELAVPLSRNPLYAGLNSPWRVYFPKIGMSYRPDAAQQTVMNLVRSGRKQR